MRFNSNCCFKIQQASQLAYKGIGDIGLDQAFCLWEGFQSNMKKLTSNNRSLEFSNKHSDRTCSFSCDLLFELRQILSDLDFFELFYSFLGSIFVVFRNQASIIHVKRVCTREWQLLLLKFKLYTWSYKF